MRDSSDARNIHLRHSGLRDEKRYLPSEDYFITHDLVDQSSAWKNISIPRSAQDCSQSLKFLIRKGIPDECRDQVI